MKKRKLFLWCLYDFANSIVFANFLVYFSKWLVLDGGISDMAYNAVFAITAGALIFTAPALAAHTDRRGGKKLFLNISTIGTIVSYLAAAMSAISGANAWPAFLAFAAGQYFYQLSFIFYDPMLNDIADEEHRGRASGLGQFSNSAGMIFGLAASIPLVQAGGRLAPLIPSVLLFAILAMPMMLFYKERGAKITGPSGVKIRLGFDWKKFRRFISTSRAAPILIAFFFYTNALNTITNNYSIYAGRVLGITDGAASVMLIIVQIAAAMGALFIGCFGDKLGARRALNIILWVWLFLIAAISAAGGAGVFFALAGVLGLTVGAGWAASRAHISANLETGEVGYGFSFYTIFERFSSMAGPMLWGGILAAGFGYRAAMLSMTIFIVLGIFALNRKHNTNI